MKRFVIYISLICLCVGCSQDSPVSGDNVNVSLAITRADAGTEARTYRVLLFNALDNSYMNYEGTYYSGPEAPESITTGVVAPWDVKSNGTTDAVDKDITKGLYAPSGEYQMIVASPGVAMTKQTNSNKYGFRYPRVRTYSNPLSISKPIPVSIQGRAASLGSDGVYHEILSLDETACHLSERRSMLRFIFKCGDQIDEATITRASVDNLIKETYINPITGDFLPLTEDTSNPTEDYMLSTSDIELFKGGAESHLPVLGDAVNNGAQYLFLLSQDYSKGLDVGKPVYDIPELHLEINGKPVNIVLAYNFLPLHYYTYTVTINSQYIGLSLAVGDWGYYSYDDQITAPPEIHIGNYKYDLTDWDTPESGASNGTIG